MSERTQGSTLVEIGHGYRPAITSGGTLFEDPSVKYLGIDLSDVKENPHLLTIIKEARENRPGSEFINGNMKAMPLRNSSVDYVVGRSIFGQFTSRPQVWPCPFDDVFFNGITEVRRVLVPGGKFVILEENTPWGKEHLEGGLKSLGYEIENLVEMEDDYEKLDESSDWKKLRTPFFDIPPTHGPSYNFDTPYILIARKPEA